MAFRALLVDSHRGDGVNYLPWMTPDKQYLGWHTRTDDGEEQYIYMVPSLDESDPTVAVYMGPHGDPTKDHKVVEIIGPDKGDTDNGN